MNQDAAAEQRRIYPAANDPGAMSVAMCPSGISAPPDIAIIAIDDAKFGPDRERPVRIVMSAEQAADLVRLLQALLDELRA